MPPFAIAAVSVSCLFSLCVIAGLAWRIGIIGERRDFAFLGVLAAILLAVLVCLASEALA